MDVGVSCLTLDSSLRMGRRTLPRVISSFKCTKFKLGPKVRQHDALSLNYRVGLRRLSVFSVYASFAMQKRCNIRFQLYSFVFFIETN